VSVRKDIDQEMSFLPDGDDGADLYTCVHCGLCLNVCPTYIETGLETESPRGRIALMKAVREQRITFTPRVVSHMDLCLQCRACEAACPSGVPFGRLMEHTRAEIAIQRKSPLLRRTLLRLFFRHLIPHPQRLYLMAKLLRLYQSSPLYWLLSNMPGLLGQLHTQLPKLPKSFFYPSQDTIEPTGTVTATVGLLSGCIMPLAQSATMEAAVRVLRHNGCSVRVPIDQVCCGALNLHGGDRATAQQLAKQNIDAFLDGKVDRVIVASAGCGSTLKEYGELLKNDAEYYKKAKHFSSLVSDITEFLAGLPLVPPEHLLSMKVTYQDPCHLAHAQRITSAPREVLQTLPGLELIEMDKSSDCCGAAGLYGILQPKMSQKLIEHKVKAVLATSAEVVASANPGCIIQLQAGLWQKGSHVKVRHVVDLLDEAYHPAESSSPMKTISSSHIRATSD
jgi:glycolate oxidase iron-sulfur subunit